MEESIATLAKFFTKQVVKLPENGDAKEQKEKKEMGQIINNFTNMRVRERINRLKINAEIDEEIQNWKREKIGILQYSAIEENVYNIHSIIRLLQLKIPKNTPPTQAIDAFQAFHIKKTEIAGLDDQKKKKIRTFIENRVTTLEEIKKKLEKAKQEFASYSNKSKSTEKGLKEVKRCVDFDYAENSSFLKIQSKSNPNDDQAKQKKNKQIIAFYRASKNFPSKIEFMQSINVEIDPSFYRSLVKINITPKTKEATLEEEKLKDETPKTKEELEFDFATLEEEKLKDIYDKMFCISLALKKKDKKRSLVSFQYGNPSPKTPVIELKILNMQLFNYLLQIISFGKVVPFEFKHSKTELEIDCKHHMALELAYRKKEELKSTGKDTNNIMIYVN